jgi:putative ABC transport system permease protein
LQDLRLAIRALWATPIVTAVAIVSLALGIGANTAIFTLVDSLVLRTLPVRDPQRLALVSGGGVGTNNRFSFSYATLNEIRQHGQAFDGALAYNCCGKAMLTVGEENQIVDRMWISGDFFRTLGVPALLGRTITPEDDVPGGGSNGPVVVISYDLWQQRFGGAAGIVGQSVTIERIPVTVVGVAPPEFFGVEVGRTVDLLLPIRTEPLILPAIPLGDDISFLALVLRLKPGQSLATATAALRAVQPQIRAAAMPHDNPRLRPTDFLNVPFTLNLAGTGVSPLRQQFQRPLVALLIVVILVLVIACVNIANLMLARGVARRYELAMKWALGASRWRLVRPLVMESVLVASLGTSLAFLFAAWASRAIVA